ncbi:MAG: hypothetical protein Q7T97_07005 [Burkholderiaceae bacterium]|nr:hypothetical protein [Burkholderiaceae bacterium]
MQKIEQTQLDAHFHRVASERWATLLATGKTVTWEAAKAYLEDRSRGQCSRKPLARKSKR